jgi:hypothetical protein
MNHRQLMTDRQRLDWDSMQYKRMKECNKGHNYSYWSDKYYNMINNEWTMYLFETGYEKEATTSETLAKCVVDKLRDEGNFARIVCGYLKNKQRQKMFSVIYKNKKNDTNKLSNRP